MRTLALLLILMLSVGGVIILSADVSVSQPPPPPPPPPSPPPAPGDAGYLLKRSLEETCHACHKTDKNSPADPDAIKTHNSVNTGSSKWSGNGGWGVENGKYGEFVCTTCHTAHDTRNIYLIKETITTPDKTSWGSSGGSTLGVDFEVKSGTPGVTPGVMGDDTTDHLTSARVCQVCHSITQHHNYNTANTPSAGRGHYDAKNCADCHDHKGAFKPTCKSCHGFPPQSDTPGYGGLVFNPSATGETKGASHVKHATGGSNYNFACSFCHSGGMTSGNQQDYKIQIGFDLFGGAYTGNGTTYGGDSAALINNYTYNFTNGTVKGSSAFVCTNIYCHGSTIAPNGGTNITPTWGDATTAACGTCHGATASNPPKRGSHARHTGNSASPDSSTTMISPLTCDICHSATVDTAGNIIDKTKHVNNSADWKFSGDPRVTSAVYNNASSGSKSPVPSGTYNSCNYVYCHSNASPLQNNDVSKNVPNIYKTPTWGDKSKNRCSNNPDQACTQDSQCPGGTCSLACFACHKGRSANSNLSVQQWDDNTQGNCCTEGGGVWNSNNSTCTGATSSYWDTYCATTQSLCVAKGYNWDTIQHVCRGDSTLTATKCADTTSAGLSGRWVAACVNSQTDQTPVLTVSSNAHRRLAGPQWIRKYPCIYCHADTVDAYGNIRGDKSSHVNFTKNVRIHTTQGEAQGITDWRVLNNPTEPTFDTDPSSPTYLSCKNIYCHSDGTRDITYTVVSPAPWNGASMQCNSCHGHPQGACFAQTRSDGSTVGCHDGTTVQSNNLILPTLCSNITPDVCSTNNGVWSGVFCQGISATVCATLNGQVGWPTGQEWMSAMPMFPNMGPDSDRPNSHPRHIQSSFTCSTCHYNTVSGGDCTTCHTGGTTGGMGEVSHVNPKYHVNKVKDVAFKDTNNYHWYPDAKGGTCQNPCHTSPTGPQTPRWGGLMTEGYLLCKNCHGTKGSDLDFFGSFNNDPTSNQRPLINLDEWQVSGHGRTSGRCSDSTDPKYNDVKLCLQSSSSATWIDNFSGDPWQYQYPESGNPAANLPGNACYYCHDNNVFHTDPTNPFRLKKHDQFKKRYEKECVYCHMQGQDSECLGCHYTTEETLAPQLSAIYPDPGNTKCNDSTTWPDGSSTGFTPACPDHRGYGGSTPTSCTTALNCHYVDSNNPANWTPDYNNVHNDFKRHNTGAGLWTTQQQSDIKNQYVWMGVCLKCHEEDAEGQCNSCHANPSDPKYKLGYDGGQCGALGSQCSQYFRTALKAKASSMHYGYKHYSFFLNSGGWTTKEDGTYSGTTKGGKFCWDCHDPHGDREGTCSNATSQTCAVDTDCGPQGSGNTCTANGANYNIYMIQSKVGTSTDGVFGKPLTRSGVSFLKKTGKTALVDNAYAKSSAPFNGICNVCHETKYDESHTNVVVQAKHYTNSSGDHHNESKVCTQCHQHKFTDSHSSGLACNTCHLNKPVPKHTGFSLPRDCTKCHVGIAKRLDIMGQMTGNAHHVQGVTISNKHCYICHWEATSIGLIDVNYHLGYNYKTHVVIPDQPVQLVLWGAGTRPTTYTQGSTVVGTDGNNYTCIQDHTSSSANQPVTGTNWSQYWRRYGTAGAAWTSGAQYSAVTGTTFLATNVGTTNERPEVEKVTSHCLSCHNDLNNDTKAFSYCSNPLYLTEASCTSGPEYCTNPKYKNSTDCTNPVNCYCSYVRYTSRSSCEGAGFTWICGTWGRPTWVSDCKVPRQYAWDKQSIASRYLQTGTTTWGKYVKTNHLLILTMDEASWTSGAANTVLDKSPYGHHGTPYNATTAEAGRFERAGSFNGANGYVDLAYAGLNNLQNWTFTAWIYPQGGNQASYIYSEGGSTATLYISSDSSGNIQVYTWNSTRSDGSGNPPRWASYTTTSPVLTADTWNFVAVSLSGGGAGANSGVVTIYANGSSYTGLMGSEAASPTNAVIGDNVGSKHGSQSSYPFRGYIDQVVLYDRALTSAELDTLSQGMAEYIGCDNCNTAPRNFTKAYSAHGNAVANQGGWDNSTTTCSGGPISSSYYSSICTSNGGTWDGLECLGLTQSMCTTAFSTCSCTTPNSACTGNQPGTAISSSLCPSTYAGNPYYLCLSLTQSACNAIGGATWVSGAWTSMRGLDGNLSTSNMRQATHNVQCFDCHSSHGSKISGITSSYTTTYGALGVGQYGGNLKDTTAGKGGYAMSYTASSRSTSGNPANPYNAGAGQCFDCHESPNVKGGTCTGTSGSSSCSQLYTDKSHCQNDSNCTWDPTLGGIPWGYYDTFGVSNAIMGYKDTSRFGQGVKASQSRYTYRSGKNTIVGGHLKASSSLNVSAQGTINGLCTPCHDPHGVSPTLGANQQYGVPLLKGTWLTSPYKEDTAQTNTGETWTTAGGFNIQDTVPTPFVYLDRKIFGGGVCSNNSALSCQNDPDCPSGYCTGSFAMTENETQFAGLCLNCHPKTNLTNGTKHDWKDWNRVHESVKGWKTADSTIQHNYPCSKCHQPHNSGLPRLMQTDCLDWNHRGRVSTGGNAAFAGNRQHQPVNASNNSGIALVVYSGGGFPKGYLGGRTDSTADYNRNYQSKCHPSSQAWPDNKWNDKTPWP